ncbi:GNAT family N-acetyltransferase [Facklamia hominis]|uniref:GNAT family N-acetyltransferase n=1 Tax=Facklamia hominis TaxID=178214 RepID=UPI00101CFCE2|nr:GNAT family N-acetyltransferase [Facklamia hominis]RYC97506.1 GNAT family N-acetyltransferase [Facklamia hominis]
MLQTYRPKLEDLWFMKQLLADPETMAFNHAYGGTIDFSEDKWPDWYHRWIEDPQDKRYYRYLQAESGDFVGEIAYHYDEDQAVYLSNIKIYAPYRRRGYGRAGLALLCERAKSHGIEALYDSIAIDNPSVSLFLNQGFIELFRNEAIIMVKKQLI